MGKQSIDRDLRRTLKRESNKVMHKKANEVIVDLQKQLNDSDLELQAMKKKNKKFKVIAILGWLAFYLALVGCLWIGFGK